MTGTEGLLKWPPWIMVAWDFKKEMVVLKDR